MDNTTAQIIDQVIVHEGGSAVTADPSDRGGRTQYGIAERSNPDAWADGKVTLDEARAIYFKKYVEGPGYAAIADQRLLHQMVDFGVNSGPASATRTLQEVLGVAADGSFGPATLAAVEKCESRTLNNALAARRVQLLCRICVKNPSQLKFLVGWVNRALEFLI